MLIEVFEVTKIYVEGVFLCFKLDDAFVDSADDLSFKMVRSKDHLICNNDVYDKNCTLMLKSGGGFMPFDYCRPRLVSIELAHAAFFPRNELWK